MSSSCKSRIPERVKHSLTALHGPNSRISRARSLVRSNRCALFRSRLPLPIRTLALALVSEIVKQPEVPKPRPREPARETERETDAVIRSLVRRSIPPAVRGNRTSFRRIQLAHSLPQMASVSLVMKPASRWESQQNQPNPNQQLPPPPLFAAQEDRLGDDEISARSLLELVAGKWQPDMQTMRFLCSDHRLINVPSRLMNRHSVLMNCLEALEQPIELRSIRSVTLLRVVMWMHQKSLSGEMPTSSDDADKQSCICDNQENGNEETNTTTMEYDMCDEYSDSESESTDDSSTEFSESTQEIVTSTTETIESIRNQICSGYTRSRYESTDSTLKTERIRNRIYGPYSRGGLGSDDENICENYENAENLKYRKLNGYTEGAYENHMLNYFRSGSVREEKVGRLTSNSKLNRANGNGSGSDKENVITNRYANSQQDRFQISPKDSGIFRENSGKNNHYGMENGKEKGYIEGELSEHIFRTTSSQRKPNLSHRNVSVNVNLSEKASVTANRREASECEEKLAPNVGQNQIPSEPTSWEQQLLGSELYQLVELILAAHYMGIDGLTLLATQHFGQLMAQRTRSERCLMLRIRTHLAGVRQTLDTHRPPIRDKVTQ
ncbi:hypothetical protein KR084_003550, partial [Drosophila pseudotakahashii]